MSRVSFYTKPFDRLEPYDGKLSRTVLRGGMGSNVYLLPDISSEKDILKLVNVLMANTKGDNRSSEEFWVNAEKLLYMALIGYIWLEAPEEEKNFSLLLDMLNEMEIHEDDDTFRNPVDHIFDNLKKRDKNHFAVRQYLKFRMAAGVICSKRLIYQTAQNA